MGVQCIDDLHCNFSFGNSSFLVHAREVPVSQAKRAWAYQGTREQWFGFFSRREFQQDYARFPVGLLCKTCELYLGIFLSLAHSLWSIQLALLRHWPAAAFGLTSHGWTSIPLRTRQIPLRWILAHSQTSRYRVFRVWRIWTLMRVSFHLISGTLAVLIFRWSASSNPSPRGMSVR